MKKSDKEKVVEVLHEKASRATFAAVTDFRGMDVARMSALRISLREAGVDYQVVKNTLLLRASEGTGVITMSDHFKGPCAVAMCYTDPVAAAKALTAFAAQNDKVFTIKAAMLSGKAMSAVGVKALSEMPPLPVMQAQFLGVLNAVPEKFVRLLAAVPQSMLNVLNAAKDKMEQEAA